MNNELKFKKISVAVCSALLVLAPYSIYAGPLDNTADISTQLDYGLDNLGDYDAIRTSTASDAVGGIVETDDSFSAGVSLTGGGADDLWDLGDNSGSVTVSGDDNWGIDIYSVVNINRSSIATYSQSVVGSFGNQGYLSRALSKVNGAAQTVYLAVENSGTISASGSSSIGIALTSAATANAIANADIDFTMDSDNQGEDERTGSVFAAAQAYSSASAKVIGNQVTNSGIITSTGSSGYGIRLNAEATATTSTVSATADFRDYTTDNMPQGTSTSYHSQVDAYVNDNDLTNSGSVSVSDGAGIVLDATAVADTSSDYTDDNSDIDTGYGISGGEDYAYGYAKSQVNGNTISNSGTISADYAGVDTFDNANTSDGIRLSAVTEHVDDAGLIDVTTFTAEVDDNTITNTNLIYGMRDGIRLSADNDANDSVTGAAVTNNVINNNYVGWDDDRHTEEGRIVSNQRGIYIIAQTDDGENTTPARVNGNTINNSSLIVSDPGMSLDGTALIKSELSSFDDENQYFIAIELDGQGDGNTLNLNNPAYLAGTILLSNSINNDTNTTVNLTSGYSHSNVWSIQNDNRYGPADVNLLGQLPWFVRESTVGVNGETNNTYATYDPSMLAARANAAADLSEAANVAIATNMTRDLKAPSQLWMTGSYGNNRYDQRESNPNMDQKTRLYTVAVGYDQTVDNYRVGVMAGYNQSRLTTGSLYSDLYAHSYDNESSGGFASLYGMRDLGMFKLDLGLSAGAQEHDDKRFVNDNLEWWGISYAKSNYNSQWVSPSAKLALPFDLGSDWTVAPNAQVSYTYQRIGSYTEKESNSNASFDSYGIGVVESRLAVDLSKDVGGLKATLTGGYMNRDVKSGNSIDMTMIGHKQQVDSWTQNLDAVFARLSLKYDITDKFAINAMGSYMKAKHQGSDDGTSGGYGNLSLIYKF